MPQLVPFYFVNQLLFLFLSLIVLIYILTKFILPFFTSQQVVRLYISNLLPKYKK